jgi:hypothetical protein
VDDDAAAATAAEGWIMDMSPCFLLFLNFTNSTTTTTTPAAQQTLEQSDRPQLANATRTRFQVGVAGVSQKGRGTIIGRCIKQERQIPKARVRGRQPAQPDHTWTKQLDAGKPPDGIKSNF